MVHATTSTGISTADLRPGGLDIVGQFDRVAEVVRQCRGLGIFVSLFIDPDPRQVEASLKAGADAVELHSGRYADAPDERARAIELEALELAGGLASSLGMKLHAGHGLNLINTPAVARIAGMDELNIGHSLISRAVFIGLENAVREMKTCLANVEKRNISSIQGR